MRIIFDQGTPAPLRRVFIRHLVCTAYEMGWASFENGDLLAAATKAAFDLLITTDQNLKFQQDLPRTGLAILVLPTASRPETQKHLPQVTAAVESMTPGDFLELKWVP